MRSLFCALLVLLALPQIISAAGVKKIKSNADFRKALALSKKKGAFLVVDFYTDSCGPCRMIAPAFKKLAKEYGDRAIFAKVDTHQNDETPARFQIRSTPTFLFFVDGKNKAAYQFSGAGEQQLRQYSQMAARDAEKVFVEISRDLLERYYAKYDSEKTSEAVDKVYRKCLSMAKSDRCEGSTAVELAKKLKLKYGKGPRPEPKSRDAVDGSEAAAAKKQADPAQSGQTGGNGKGRKAAAGPLDLTQASVEELRIELEQRGLMVLAAEDAARVESILGDHAEVVELDDIEEDEDEDEWEEWSFPEDPNHVEKVVIVGGGPAGLSAAIYAARAGLEPLIIAPPVGGQLQGKGVNVENYPGVLTLTGPQLVGDMQKHARLFGGKFLFGLVDEVAFDTRPFTIRAKNETLRSHAVILSTGADAKWLNVDGEEAFRGGGVSSCATCDGYLFRDLPTVVVGGGDAAMEDALVLARTSSSVTVLHRRDAFRASKILADRVLQNPKIEVRWNTTVKAFDGESPCNRPLPTAVDEEVVVEPTQSDDSACLRKVHVRHVHDGSEDTVEAAAAFIAIGHNPNTNLFRGELEVDGTGYVVTRPASTMTSVPGVFAAGDVADKIYRQAITSAGSGAAAALDAERWLSEMGLGMDLEGVPPAVAAGSDEL